ncbi:MAG: glutathione S-transferase family protein [Rhodospirillales bacterium]
MTTGLLTIGNRRYSSWSLRGWLATRLAGLDCETRVIWLDEPGYKEAIAKVSPAGTVPVLDHDGVTVGDSFAIGLYLAERFPAAGFWPADRHARAEAYALTAEMHAGFSALRRDLPMDLGRRGVPRAEAAGPELERDLARIAAIWSAVPSRPGSFLFGKPGLVDCFYAPVASRLRSYAVPLPGPAADYAATLLDWPLFREWEAEAALETKVIANP